MYEHRDDIQRGVHDPSTDTLQRRLRLALLAAVGVVLVAAIPGIVLGRGSDSKKLTSGQAFVPVTTTTTGFGVVAGVPMPPLPAPTTTTTARGSVPALKAAPGPSTTTAAHPAPAPTPSPKPCRNSYDPVCGPFRWDPDPGTNAPLNVTASAQPQQVNAGTEVNFHIVADDPDAKIAQCVVFVDFGDGQTGGTCPPPPACQTPYGPWTPPARVKDHWETDIKHTYATAGWHTASFQVQSHSFCNPDPYGGSGQAPATVEVK